MVSLMSQTLEAIERRATALERTQSDATETLRWVVTKLARLQAVQDEHTLRLERVEARLERVEERVDALPRAIAELIDASEKRLMAAIAGR
jgi:peptidoglycan hydrolase CwlO-like protein